MPFGKFFTKFEIVIKYVILIVWTEQMDLSVNEAGLAAGEKVFADEPPEYKVILLNDDYTTKEFVTEVLVRIFRKTPEEAVTLMGKVHASGSAVVGIYVYDIAATRTSATIQAARKNGFPLQCTMEKI